jgi:hypothetical protein
LNKVELAQFVTILYATSRYYDYDNVRSLSVFLKRVSPLTALSKDNMTLILIAAPKQLYTSKENSVFHHTDSGEMYVKLRSVYRRLNFYFQNKLKLK